MDPRVAQLTTPQECETFAKNALARDRPDLAQEARRRAVQLRAEGHSATTAAEKEALKAIYAYEEVLTRKNGRRTRANRTWQLIKRHGIIGGVERAVSRDTEPMGYRALVEMGLEDLAFEAVVLRHPDTFSEDAVRKSRERLSDWLAKKSDDRQE